MTDLNKLRSEFEGIPEIKTHLDHGNVFWSDKNQTYASEFQCLHAVACYVNGAWFGWQEKAKAQAVPTWISVKDEEPPTDTMVLICWSDAPDVTPEQDYMTIDEDLNSVWANYQNDPPSHWMHFHSVPNVSGAEQ
ncbi:TPA: hypothetical protein OXK50_000796 [Acinetobacter baumannii]|uniref:hypothetical protein n=1 Tax=Acinetobacter baumannii TaxID=470 RepID=UPI002291DE33|nr:hypothetical protein [Acinetobacter baumannii]MDY7273661.1 hypothetical protein [Acinetobacter baumannii]MDY7417083.1 hypothetical protein [Acinetobacter baumannii]HCT1755689.1 hypothetical protein [Acinetobacter baumannii]HCT2573662.1 hypothetical protein [Acinetobacter baumannii]HCT4551702.1 hypothetical protein [Acinetobacter baumannii]